MSYRLVIFDDNVKYICEESEVRSSTGSELQVKWINKKWYRAKIIAKGEKQALSHLLKLFDGGKVSLKKENLNTKFLIKYEDKVKQICTESEIRKSERGTMAKWSDGKWYPARILIEADKSYLEAFCERKKKMMVEGKVEKIKLTNDVANQECQKECIPRKKITKTKTEKRVFKKITNKVTTSKSDRVSATGKSFNNSTTSPVSSEEAGKTQDEKNTSEATSDKTVKQVIEKSALVSVTENSPIDYIENSIHSKNAETPNAKNNASEEEITEEATHNFGELTSFCADGKDVSVAAANEIVEGATDCSPAKNDTSEEKNEEATRNFGELTPFCPDGKNDSVAATNEIVEGATDCSPTTNNASEEKTEAATLNFGELTLSYPDGKYDSVVAANAIVEGAIENEIENSVQNSSAQFMAREEESTFNTRSSNRLKSSRLTFSDDGDHHRNLESDQELTDENDTLYEQYSSSSWCQSSDEAKKSEKPQKKTLLTLLKNVRTVTSSDTSSDEEGVKVSKKRSKKATKKRSKPNPTVSSSEINKPDSSCISAGKKSKIMSGRRATKSLKKSSKTCLTNPTNLQCEPDRAVSPAMPFINDDFEDAFDNLLRQSNSPDLQLADNPSVSTTASAIDENKDANSTNTSAPNLYEMNVNVKKSGESKNKKQQYCKFCLKPQKKLPRHLTRMHKEEDEVQEMLKYENPNDPRRQQLLTKIRNDGAFIHNRKVLIEGVGEYHTKRRPREGSSIIESATETDAYLPCPKCRASVRASYLHRHAKICKQQSNTESKKSQRGIRTEATLLLPTHHKVPENFQRDVLAKMSADGIFKIIRSDKLILEYGAHFYQKLGSKGLQAHYIGQKMREMARFLQTMRTLEKNPYMSLEGCIKPRLIEKVIEATKVVAEYDGETMRYKTPSLALKIGHGLNRCCTILRGQACQKEDEHKLKSLQLFQQTMEVNWTVKISSLALRTTKDRKVNRVETIPLIEDIRKFNIHMQENIVESLRQIKDIPTSESLTMLSRCTLALVVSFNRRRAGEVSKIRVDQAKLLEPGDPHPDVVEHLNSFELHLMRKISRFEIIGKRGRTVPVLLTPLLKEAVSVLLEPRNRTILGIVPQNPFLFAIPQSQDTYRKACNEIRNFSTKCGAKFPEHLRSTLLRIQFASLRQVDNMANNELDIIADFMGHDIRVHRQFYRLPQSTLQIAKMGKCITDANLGINLDINLDTLEIDDLDNVQLNEFEEFSEYEDSESDSPSDNANESSKKTKKPVTELKKRRIDASPSTSNITTKKFKSANDELKKRTKWSDEENKVIHEHFSTYMVQKIIPPKSVIDKMLYLLPGRNYRNVKDKVRNSFARK